MYQLSAAALALTAVLVVFTSLFDVHQARFLGSFFFFFRNLSTKFPRAVDSPGYLEVQWTKPD